MRGRARCGRWALGALVLAAWPPPGASAQAAGAETVRVRVEGLLDRKALVGLVGTADALRSELDLCATREDAADCRTVVNQSLGFLYQTEATAGTEPADSLLQRAVDYYDDAISANRSNWAAWYNKALAYRAMGAHEWQEGFFLEAADEDPERRATYLSLQGDYYAERGMHDAAARAYEEALAADPTDAAARTGLVDTYRTMGPRGLEPLFRYAERWRLAAAPAAAEAYAVLLEEAIAAGERSLADTACIRLVALQERVAGPFLTRRPDLPSVRSWEPALQVDRFMATPELDAVPWWRNGDERREALARASLLRGLSAATARDAREAERFFEAGLDLARPESAEAVDLQRELALLYTRNPALDPEGERFRELEDRMFEDKSLALASGDLEAAQRFHATLGRIYAERGRWTSERPHRSALDQLAYTLRAAEARARATGFHQPLPGIHSLLAQGLFATDRRADARDVRVSAARAWLDADDPDVALSELDAARALGAAGASLDRLAALARLRAELEGTGTGRPPGPGRAALCAEAPGARVRGTGPADFERRQRFKILADCSRMGPAADRRVLAADAVAAADTAGFTLVGAPDVRRFQDALERAVRAAGRPEYGVRDRTRLETMAPEGRAALPVAFANRTAALWLVLSEDDLVTARVVRTLGPDSTWGTVRVRRGVVTLEGTDPGPTVLRRIRALPGVRSVRVAGAGG